MRQTTGTRKSLGEKIVKDIKRATRKHYSSEEKIRIVLDGLRGEDSIAELCRREGISQGIYYKWSKHFPAVHFYMHERGLYGSGEAAFGRRYGSVRRSLAISISSWRICSASTLLL